MYSVVHGAVVVVLVLQYTFSYVSDTFFVFLEKKEGGAEFGTTSRLTHVMVNAWIVIFVCSRKAYSLGELDCSITLYLKLDAVWIELRAAPWVLCKYCVALVETQHFSSQQVSTRYQ